MGTESPKKIYEVIEGFPDARELFRSIVTSGKHAPSSIAMTMSEPVINRLKSDDWGDNNFSGDIQGRVVNLTGQLAPVAYEFMSEWVEQTPEDRDVLLNTFQGRFFYFREIKVGRNAEYDRGEMLLRQYRGIPVFDHISPNSDPAGKIEHTGFVYLANRQLFFLGFRKGAFRLASMKVRHEERNRVPLNKTVFWGTFSSIGLHEHEPIAAKFVMVHESYHDALALFDPKSPEGIVNFRKEARDSETFISGNGNAV